AEIGPALIIRDNHDHVRTFRSRGLVRQAEDQTQRHQKAAPAHRSFSRKGANNSLSSSPWQPWLNTKILGEQQGGQTVPPARGTAPGAGCSGFGPGRFLLASLMPPISGHRCLHTITPYLLRAYVFGHGK